MKIMMLVSVDQILRNLWWIPVYFMLFMGISNFTYGAPVFSDDFESGLGNWTQISGSGAATTTTQTNNSPFRSLRMGESTITLESNLIDTSGLGQIWLSAWIRRGADSFSENPDNGEDFVLEYLNTSNIWVALETFPGDGDQGEIFDRQYSLGDASHANFQIRLTVTGGSGVGWDYWHIDDISVEEVASGYVIAGNSSPISPNNQSWAWDNLQPSEFRAAVEDTNNFGSSGVVDQAVVTIDLTTLNASTLTNVDAFIASWWLDADSNAYGSVLRDFLLAGGDLVLLQDDSGHDAIGSFLGFPTIDGSSSPTTVTSPFQEGPFGAVGSLTHVGQFGYLDTNNVTNNGGTVCGTDSNGRTTIACWDEGEFAPGAGQLVITTDVDYITGDFGGANYDPLNAKGTFGLNLVDFLINGGLEPIELIGSWGMDEESYTGASGEVLDGGSNGLDGTTQNGPTTDNADPARLGNPGTCGYVNLDGSSQYISVADNDLLDRNRSVTLSVWIYPNVIPTSGEMGVLSKGSNYALAINQNNEVVFQWEKAGDSLQTLTTSGAGMSANSWVHIAATFRSGQQRLYVNGVERGSDNTVGNMATNSSALLIGQDPASSTSFFNGRIDEVRVYRGTLTSSEVDNLYQETHSCGTTGTSCTDSFTDGISSHSGGNVEFRNNAELVGSLDNLLDVGSVFGTGLSGSCGSQACSASGNAANTFNPGGFPENTSTIDLSVSFANTETLGESGGDIDRYDDVFVQVFGTLNVSSNYDSYHIDQLTLNNISTLNLRPGDYYINDLNINNTSTVNVVGPGTVRIFTNDLFIGNNAVINSPAVGVSGDVSQLFIYSYGNANIFNNINFSGVLYAQGNITIGSGTNFFGALTGNNIEIRNNATVTYDPTGVSNIDFGEHCSSSCTLGSFAITQPSFGLACPDTRLEINITSLCDDGTTTKTDYAGTINLTSNEPSLSEFYLNASGGTTITSFTFSGTENGEQNVFLYHKNENANLQVGVQDIDAGVTSTGNPGTDIRTQGFTLSGAQDFACGNTRTLVLTAVGQNSNDPAACEKLIGFDGTKNLKATYTINTDVDEIPGVADNVSSNLSINSQSLFQGVTNNLSNIDFNEGQANLNIEYLDVGEILSLDFVHDDAPYTGGAELTASASFVVYPSKIALSTDVGICLGPPSPFDQCPKANSPAGGSFNLTAKALCSNNNTVPPSYKGTVPLSLNLVAPSGGAVGELSEIAITITENGQETIDNQQISEVGVFTITPGPLKYFNVDIAGEALTNVGRFTPAYLDMDWNSPYPAFVFLGCYQTKGFGYREQEFDFSTSPVVTITAKNAKGVVTKNYDGDFFKFTNNQGNRNYEDTIPGVSTRLTQTKADPSINPGQADEYDGISTITINDHSFKYSKGNSQPGATDGPFNAETTLTLNSEDLKDDDGICYEGGTNGCIELSRLISGPEVRYGRLKIENAFGSEVEDLILPISVEYWDGNSWQVNLQDTCTTVEASNATMSNYTDALNSGETNIQVAESLIGTVSLQNGQTKSMQATGPGLGNQGSVDIELNVDTWLQFDWDGSGSADPTATATFGRFRSHDRIIYWREVAE